MNAELLKKLLAAGMDADQAIELAKNTEAAPADGVKAVVEQMAKSLSHKDDFARLEEKIDRIVTALTTVIPNGLEAFDNKFAEMQKSLAPIQEQMSKALGQPKAVQAKEGGEALPDVGANGDADPEAAAAKAEAEAEQMRKSLNSNKKRALEALEAAGNRRAIDSDDRSRAFTAINAARTAETLEKVCAQFGLTLA